MDPNKHDRYAIDNLSQELQISLRALLLLDQSGRSGLDVQRIAELVQHSVDNVLLDMDRPALTLRTAHEAVLVHVLNHALLTHQRRGWPCEPYSSNDILALLECVLSGNNHTSVVERDQLNRLKHLVSTLDLRVHERAAVVFYPHTGQQGWRTESEELVDEMAQELLRRGGVAPAFAVCSRCFLESRMSEEQNVPPLNLLMATRLLRKLSTCLKRDPDDVESLEQPLMHLQLLAATKQYKYMIAYLPAFVQFAKHALKTMVLSDTQQPQNGSNNMWKVRVVHVLWQLTSNQRAAIHLLRVGLIKALLNVFCECKEPFSLGWCCAGALFQLTCNSQEGSRSFADCLKQQDMARAFITRCCAFMNKKPGSGGSATVVRVPYSTTVFFPHGPFFSVQHKYFLHLYPLMLLTYHCTGLSPSLPYSKAITHLKILVDELQVTEDDFNGLTGHGAPAAMELLKRLQKSIKVFRRSPSARSLEDALAAQPQPPAPCCDQFETRKDDVVARYCARCYDEESGERLFQVCGRCRTTTYCSRGCQQSDWGEHQVECCVAPLLYGEESQRG